MEIDSVSGHYDEHSQVTIIYAVLIDASQKTPELGFLPIGCPGVDGIEDGDIAAGILASGRTVSPSVASSHTSLLRRTRASRGMVFRSDYRV